MSRAFLLLFGRVWTGFVENYSMARGLSDGLLCPGLHVIQSDNKMEYQIWNPLVKDSSHSDILATDAHSYHIIIYTSTWARLLRDARAAGSIISQMVSLWYPHEHAPTLSNSLPHAQNAGPGPIIQAILPRRPKWHTRDSSFSVRKMSGGIAFFLLLCKTRESSGSRKEKVQPSVS